MFFIFGTGQKEKNLEFHQTKICNTCGRFGSLDVFMVYSYLHLFFIPLFRWGKKYYARSGCCGTLYALNSEVGQQIARGEAVTIQDSDLTPLNQHSNTSYPCPSCGFSVEKGFTYCPKCGKPL